MISTNTFTSTIKNLITTLDHKFEKNPNLKPSEIISIIAESKITEDNLLEWADYDHPAEESYGRKMIHKHPNYEVMVMSWNPGDYAAIHDHGYTQWGAVKIFGSAEHATFRWQDDELSTLSRHFFEPGKIIGVSHSLIHSMGNPTDKPFLSLHIYGTSSPKDFITGDARLFNLENNTIQRVNGGVFYELPKDQILNLKDGPSGDFPTRTRFLIDLLRRVEQFPITNQTRLNEIYNDLFASTHLQEFINYLSEITKENDHIINSTQWDILNNELKELSKMQRQADQNPSDAFHKYAELYDSLICKPCKDGFILNYLHHFIQNYLNKGIQEQSILSLGCGTGMIEKDLIDEFKLNPNKLIGVDSSEAMVGEAKKRINAIKGDLLDLNMENFDIAYSGLNVYQYLPANKLEIAISNTAKTLKKGGWFVGDFITLDHIRWYPNVMYNKTKDIISLRTPRLIEKEGKTYQESEIINLDFRGKLIDVNYAGKHSRYLAPIIRIREYFKKHFNSDPILLDAYSLKEINKESDTCNSTRYVLIVKKY